MIFKYFHWGLRQVVMTQTVVGYQRAT